MEVDDLSKIGDNSPPLNMLDVVERQVMRVDGVYVDGSIQGIKVTFTADTGAARTVILSKLFRKIPNSKKPRLERSSALASLDISQQRSCLVLTSSYVVKTSYHYGIYQQTHL
jgi:hypothetical protein